MQNVNAVRQGIAQKINYNCPYYPTIDDATSVVTDFDTFPYPRYYRGEYNVADPIVFEREAGFRTRNDNCYRMTCMSLPKRRPQYCWQNSCSVVLPCRPDEQIKYADKQEYDLMMQKGCIVNYR